MNALTKIENTAIAAMTEDDLVSVLRSSLYPGAQLESIKMVLGYCKASGLDPMQKPVHIVPMKVSTGEKDSNGYDIKAMRDVIMPGVGLYRTQAARTGEYAGVSDPEFGPTKTLTFNAEKWVDGPNNRRQKTTVEDRLEYPEWCKVSVTRMVGGHLCTFPAREYWLENYATKGDGIEPNAMWKKRPFGQIAKCAEAQALRKAFPEQTGSQPTAEEMEGKSLEPTERHMGAAEVVQPVEPAPLVVWPQDAFDKKLPTFRKAIADGKSADDIVSWAKTKGELTPEQEAAIRAPAASKDAAPSFATIADKLSKAKDADALALAGDLIKSVADEAQRTELQALYDLRETEMKK